MNPAPIPRAAKKALKAALWVAAAVTVVAIAGAAFLDSGYCRESLIHYLAARSGRPIQVDGALKVHLLSTRPSLTAEGVTLGNPPWMLPGVTARVGKLSMQFDFPWPWRTASVRRLEMTSATLYLTRDAAGRANWQSRPPGTSRRGTGHLLRSLSMPNAQVVLDDARRHLQFTGVISAGDVAGPPGASIHAPTPTAGTGAGAAPTPAASAATAERAPALRIEGSGELNGRPATFTINADPLATASHDRPYGFSFVEQSGDARLSGSGHLLKPFDPGVLDTSFDAAGASLRESYFLVGISLPETASFTLSGKLARRGPRSEFRDLLGHFGKSDVHGDVILQIVGGRPRFDADLRSGLLRLADLGRHEADGSPARAQPSPFWLPDNQLPLNGLRNRDWVVSYEADTIEMRGHQLHAFATRATVDAGVLTAPAFAATFNEAQLAGSVKIDTAQEPPKTDLDLQISNLQLSRFSREGLAKPPFDGALQAHAQVTGRGSSVHEFAASANGTVAAVLPHGSMRASLAELTGINLRGIGLRLMKSDEEATVRCAIASFEARDGTLSARQFIIDTDPMLITGTGVIHLDSEALDLTLHGRPTSAQFVRIRSPIHMRGSLRHPEFGLDRGKLVAQAGEAIALGVALTPVAAVIAFADPGVARDGDCGKKLVAASTPRDRKAAKGITESAKRGIEAP